VFDETLWHSTLKRTLKMDELIQKHGEIMDRFDPEKRVGMIIDEWGTWYDVEPGTNPGFLYQQNTIRDALVAALNFHIFHRYADRVTMTNIAQTVNVLQTMILTDGEKMVLTPTYHVFEMFKRHQGGTYLPVTLSTPDYRHSDDSIPAVSASASRSLDGGMVLSLAGTSPTEAVTITLSGVPSGHIRGRLLTAETMQSHNTFEAPATVQPADLTDFVRDGDILTVTLPPMSVAVLEIAG
jgi:alpha-N-arabinofuranosidase